MIEYSTSGRDVYIRVERNMIETESGECFTHSSLHFQRVCDKRPFQVLCKLKKLI